MKFIKGCFFAGLLATSLSFVGCSSDTTTPTESTPTESTPAGSTPAESTSSSESSGGGADGSEAKDAGSDAK